MSSQSKDYATTYTVRIVSYYCDATEIIKCQMLRTDTKTSISYAMCVPVGHYSFGKNQAFLSFQILGW
jgi:hypothetical protein